MDRASVGSGEGVSWHGKGVGWQWIGRRLAVDRVSVGSGYGGGWQWIGRRLSVDVASVGNR